MNPIPRFSDIKRQDTCKYKQDWHRTKEPGYEAKKGPCHHLKLSLVYANNA